MTVLSQNSKYMVDPKSEIYIKLLYRVSRSNVRGCRSRFLTAFGIRHIWCLAISKVPEEKAFGT